MKGCGNGVFVDWFSASQLHPEGGLPVITGGLVVHYDASGLPRFEFNRSASIGGSHETAVRVGCDGYRVSLSGNPGRFSRPDNLFNHGFPGTVEAANRILQGLGLPAFTPTRIEDGQEIRGCVVSRLDITSNLRSGSESQARAVIRWLQGRSIARMKRGFSGDESVWYANTHHMLKAYRKAPEMIHHGLDKDHPAVQWAQENGVVRVEVELKKRLLSKLDLQDLANITDDKLISVFHEQTEVFRSVDRSDEPDILDACPVRSRAYAAAWLAGQDVRLLCSQATLYRHAKALRDLGIDILEPRNVEKFPVKVRVVELEPLEVPDWYRVAA